MTNGLTPEQDQVAQDVLDHEGTQRHHLVIHLSGAHAYGFPSHDSDLDLKAVHIEPTRNLLGLGKTTATANRLEVIDGVEIDYTSNELQTCVSGLVSGDGNMLERVFSSTPMRVDPLIESLKPLATGCLSRRYARHYRGFARSQERALREAEAPSAKKLLYVLRTALTGAHLLTEREVQPDLTALYEQYGFPEVPELVELKQSAERGSLPEPWPERIDALVARAFDALDAALESSPLPEEAPGVAALEEWLLEVRRERW